MEIMVLSILGPVLLCEWNLQTWEEALITTVTIDNYFRCKDLKIHVENRSKKMHSF